MVSSMVDSSDITTQLNILGLDERESAVYSELVEREAVSILDLSRKLEIPRTNVYRTCEGLVKKNFAEWVILSNTKKIKAVLPKDLIFVLNEQKQKLEESESALNQLNKLIQTYSVLPQTL